MAKDEEKDPKDDAADEEETSKEKAAAVDANKDSSDDARSSDSDDQEDSDEEDSDEEDSDEEDSDEEPVAAKASKEEAHEDHGSDDDDAHAVADGPEPPMEKDTPKMRIITGAFVVVAALVIGTVIGVTAFFNSLFLGEQQRKVGTPVAESLIELHKLEDKHLTTYQWVDEKKGIVRIPLTKARDVVVARYQATPINTEAPPPPPPPNPLGDWTDIELPGGVKINALSAGVEAKLLGFIQDKEKVIDETTPAEWFDFDHLLFDTGKSTLQAESEKQLKNVFEILKAFPSAEVKIGAYTDNTGDAEANKKLSTERAQAVVAELEKLGVEKKRMKAEGYGQEHPVAPNDTEEGRAKNRRVSVRVTKK
jgi:outer membrane protein OmpA-like peptidoglycan-associated protein